MAFKIKNAPTFFLLLTTFFFHIATPIQEGTSTTGGHWVQLQRSIGISAMHMQVMYDNKVVIFDRTDFGPSNISLSNHRCRYNPRDLALKLDCTAHSVLYDLVTDTVRPLTLHSDAWCSSGALTATGTLLQTGGFNDGYTKLRSFTPCPDHNMCDWHELTSLNLTTARWYSSNQILPNGAIIVVGGRNSFTYEFVPRNQNDASFHFLPFLKLTRDPNRGEENNLYPFLHLLPDGNLFIFANRNSILFDYTTNKVLREFPLIPGEEKRNYPSTGSSILLPLNLTGLYGARLPDAEIMICGGAYPNAFSFANNLRIFLEASRTCGRLRVSDPEPEWVMETMPMARVMPDMILLPTGNVIILNGAMNGTAGWENAANPVLYPVLYRPGLVDPLPRFQVLAPAGTPRLYHSSAVLLPDGRVLVGGSNPHRAYDFRAYYRTELSLDAYYPDYLGAEMDHLRPSIVAVEAENNTASCGRDFGVTFEVREYGEGGVGVTLVAPSFTTHSFAMNQRLLVLDVVEVREVGDSAYKVVARGPPSLAVAPPGYYMLFILHVGVPSAAVWIQVK